MGVDALSAVHTATNYNSPTNRVLNNINIGGSLGFSPGTRKSEKTADATDSADSLYENIARMNIKPYRPDFSAAVWSDTVTVIKVTQSQYSKVLQLDMLNQIPEIEPVGNLRTQNAVKKKLDLFHEMQRSSAERNSTGGSENVDDHKVAYASVGGTECPPIVDTDLAHEKSVVVVSDNSGSPIKDIAKSPGSGKILKGFLSNRWLPGHSMTKMQRHLNHRTVRTRNDGTASDTSSLASYRHDASDSLSESNARHHPRHSRQ